MPKTHPTPKLVIFDCDGVLVDSEVISCQAVVDNLARHGLHMDLADCMELFVGTSLAKAMEVSRDMGADLPEGWVAEMHGELDAVLQAGTPLVAGVPALLDRLERAGIPYCVASNGRAAKMEITLGQNGLWDKFRDAVFSAYDLKVFKPDPGLFQAAASHFDVQARDCLVVEDSAPGALAAARAGMRCLGYAPHDDGAKLAAQGAEVFADMAQVPGLLGLN